MDRKFCGTVQLSHNFQVQKGDFLVHFIFDGKLDIFVN